LYNTVCEPHRAGRKIRSKDDGLLTNGIEGSSKPPVSGEEAWGFSALTVARYSILLLKLLEAHQWASILFQKDGKESDTHE
jgi:hypothetical protein